MFELMWNLPRGLVVTGAFLASGAVAGLGHHNSPVSNTESPLLAVEEQFGHRNTDCGKELQGPTFVIGISTAQSLDGGSSTPLTVTR